MTLNECLEIGKECGLTTIAECYDMIDMHCMNLFDYNDINKEMLELQKDIFKHHPDEFCKIFNATKEDLIEKGWEIV